MGSEVSAATGFNVLAALFVLTLLVAAGLLAWWIARSIKAQRMIAEAKARTNAWKAANPVSPPMTDAQFKAYRDWYETLSLPTALLAIGEPVTPSATGSHIGGQVWLPDGETWPTSADGQGLSFLAQIDFSELPKLKEFPDKGVLQFFIGRDDLFGAKFEELEQGKFKLIWRPHAGSDGTLHESPRAEEDCTPLSNKLRNQARRLVASAASMSPSSFNLISESFQPNLMRCADAERLIAFIEAKTADTNTRHHVGGHVDFTQDDFRKDARYREYSHVLLQLWSENDSSLMWGDMGQANFMITQSDLVARDFSRVTFHWDCY